MPATAASKRDKATFALYEAMTAALDGRRVSGAEADSTTMTWRNVLLIPGLGFLVAVCLLLEGGALYLHARQEGDAQAYRSAPMCTRHLTESCRLEIVGQVVAVGTGRHADGSAGADSWILLSFPQGERAYADFSGPKPRLTTGIPVQVVIWKGKVALVTASGQSRETNDNPIWAEVPLWGLLFTPTFLAILALLSSASVGLKVWRQAHRPAVFIGPGRPAD